jgi:MFS family permease
LCLLQLVDVLGVTVVIAALPRMLREVGAPASAGSLVATGYAMFFGGLLMLGARLGDRYGHRRIIQASLVLVAAGGVATAMAGNVVTLTVGRCLQGAGAAAAIPAALRLLTTVTADGPQRRRAIAAWSATGAAAGGIGFVVGGVVTQLVGWRPIFWGYLPLMVAIAVLVARTVPADGARRRQPLNIAGSVLLTTTVMAVVVGTTVIARPGRAPVGLGILAAAIAAGGCFALVDRRAAAPLLPERIRRLGPLWLGASGSFVNTWSTTSSNALLTLYLQDGLGWGPLAAAVALLPLSVSVVVSSTLAAPLLLRRLPTPAVASLGLGLITCSCVGLIAAAGVMPAVIAAMVAAGLGLGLSSVATNSLGTRVPEADRGAAAGILNTAAQLGAATGIAVLLLVAAATTGAPGLHTPPPRIAWAVAALTAAAATAGFAIREHTRREHSQRHLETTD